MKFTSALSSLLVVLPVLVLQASAAPSASLASRDFRGARNTRAGFGGFNNRGGFENRGGFFGNQNQNKGGNKQQNNQNNQNKGGNNNNNAGNKNAGNANAGNANAGNANAGNANAGGAAANNSTADAGNANAGNANNAGAGGNAADEQSSLTLDPSTIGPNLALDGLNNNSTEAGQSASATSTNNFINFCVGKTITNGEQVQDGSCNPVPMGNIPSKANQPSSKFVFPTNFGNVGANQEFTIQMAIQGMQTGDFVNPNTNYFGAPQDINAQGQIIGHSHVVIQQMSSITQTDILDPTKFVFFQGLNAPAQNGILTADVTKGLDAGTYKLSSINTAGNHQPALVAVAQHGSLDDAIYFTVGDQAQQDALTAIGASAGSGNAAAADNGAAATDSTAAAATDSAAAAATDSAAAAATATATAAAGNNGNQAQNNNNGNKNQQAQNNNNNNKGQAQKGNQNQAQKGNQNQAQKGNQNQKGAQKGGNPFQGKQQQQQKGRGRRFNVGRQH